LQELLDLMTEIMQSEKNDKQKDKDKGKDKKSKDTYTELQHETSMASFPGELRESVRPIDGSEVPPGIDTPPETPKTSTPPGTPLAISPVKVCAHAYVS
jgi:hypothetical protein